MSNLLKDASILLTPTAYDNGRMLSIKPSKDLYGSELVTNGDFATDSNWTKGTGWSIGNNKATSNGSSTNLDQTGTFTSSTTYKVVYTIEDYVSGDTRFRFTGTSNENGTLRSSNGTYTEYITLTNNQGILRFIGSGVLSITNISVKEDLSGDFTFSRNSAATRVNAQGLVENVQILSSNLVQNGSFSQIGAEEVSNGSFSQEGVELVTNGSFDTDTNWNGVNTNGVTISNGSLNYSETTISHNVTQGNVFEVGKSYKVTVTISNYVKGSVRISTGATGTQSLNYSSNGTFTFYGIASTNTTLYIQARGASGTTLSIDNLSVKEVGQDWTLGTGWSIGDDKAIADGTNTSLSEIRQTSVTTIGKQYKITFKVNEVNNVIELKGNSVYTRVDTLGVGTHTIYITADSTYIRFLAFVGSTCSITNISVKEVGQDWTFVGEAELTEQGARIYSSSGGQSYINQDALTNTKSYKISYDIVDSTQGALKLINVNGVSDYPIPSTVGSHTVYFTANNNTLFIYRNSGATDVTITNISVKEITDDTDLPRIDYEGFSYQDALGSELYDGNITNPVNGGTWIDNGDGTFTVTGDGTPNIAKGVRDTNAEYLTMGENYLITAVGENLTIAIYDIGYGVEASGTSPLYFTPTTTSTKIYLSPTDGVEATYSNVSVKEYLGQEVVPDSGCGSWLLEDESTNLVPYSSDFSLLNAVANAVVTSNQIISPSGLLDADEITFDGTLYGRVEASFSVTNGATYTISVYLKNKDLSDVTQVWFGFDQIGLGQFITITDEWQRYEITLAANGTTEYPRIQFSGSGSLYAWGFQTEQQSYATSYIPTSGATSTRLRDLATDSGNATLINSTEGVLYFEGSFSKNTSNQQLTLNNGTTSERIVLEVRNNGQLLRFNVRSSDTNSVEIDQSINTDTYYKLGLLWSGSIAKFYLNGSLIGSDSSVTYPIGLDSMSFNSGTNSFPFYGKTKALAVYKEALTDANLRCLTYPPAVATTFDLNFNTIATDFTFTRGSEATFVNAQGLIQSTNEIGSELITNGDFSNGLTNWSVNGGSYATIVSGALNSNNPDAGNWYAENISQNVSFVNGTTYKLTFKAKNISGNLNLRITQGANPMASLDLTSAFVDYTYFYTANADNGSIRIFCNSAVGQFQIDNVSVKEYITATNTPRLDYSTGAEAFLLEPQSTNLITYSEDFSNASYSKASGGLGSVPIVTSNYATSPSGEQNADRIQFDLNGGTDGGDSSWIFTFPALDIDGIVSVYLKTNDDSTKVVYFRNTFGTIDNVTVNGNWQRYSIGNPTTRGFYLGLRGSQGNSDSADLSVWGAQVEQQSYATSYIPTSGASATRNQELCNNATPVINSEEGVLYAEISALANSVPLQRLSLSDGTTNNRIYIQNSATTNQIFASVVSSGVSSVNFNITSYDTTQFNKIAVKYKGNDSALWINGIEVATDTSAVMPIGLSELSYDDGNGGLPHFGNTKGLKYYPKALADVQLEDLTTI